MARQILSLTAIVVGTMALAAAVPLKGAEPPAALADANFAGKILFVQAKEPIKGNYLINARVKKLGERTFLVGEYPKGPDWPDFPDVTYWLPIEDVQLIHVYKNLADAKKASEFEDKKEKK